MGARRTDRDPHQGTTIGPRPAKAPGTLARASRMALAAAALWGCLVPAPGWPAEGLAEGEPPPSPSAAPGPDFEATLAATTSLSPEAVRTLRLLFDADAATPPEELDALLQEVGTLSPRAIAQLRLALLDPDAAVRWMSVQILARDADAPLLLFARLLRDDSERVRDAAEQALVAAGHDAIALLAQVVEEEPCYAPAKVAATRALGALGDPCGIEAVAQALIKNQSGCYDHEAAFEALRRMGPPAIETLVDLLKYRLLKGGAYLVLLDHGPDALKAALLPVVVDPGREINDRLHFAEQAEVLLGTLAIFRDLDAFYLGLAADTSLPPAIAATARRVWIDRPPRPFVVEALTRERVESDYAAQRVIEEEEEAAEAERLRRRSELTAARWASAEEKSADARTGARTGTAMSAMPAPAPVRSLWTRVRSLPRGSG